jgi:flagellar basal-body rod modification protein FlgD
MSDEIALPSNIMSLQRMNDLKSAPQSTEEALGRDAFLRLFTAQLKNQDPLSPMENEAFVSQLAQFSTLESQKAMQESIESMSSNMLRERLLTGTNVLGKTIPTITGSMLGGEGRVTQASAALPAGADKVIFNVSTANGDPVYREEFGAQPSSDMKFEWAGKDNDGKLLPLGIYYVSVVIEKNGRSQAATVTTQEMIKAVRWDEDVSDIVVETETGRQINLAQLNRIEI